MTYCKQQIPDSLCNVTELPEELESNYKKIRAIKIKSQKMFVSRLINRKSNREYDICLTKK